MGLIDKVKISILTLLLNENLELSNHLLRNRQQVIKLLIDYFNLVDKKTKKLK